MAQKALFGVMAKRWFIVLVLAAAVVGGAFAQTGFQTMPKNTITVDVGPAILGGALSMGASMLGYEGSSGFGIAAQYERQLLEKLSVGARFAYGGGSMEMSDEEEGWSDSIALSSVSLEAHVRYYPFAKTFFLDGMLGYANLSVNYKDSDQLQITAKLDYVKLGVKLGWRINFGKPGGFTFEPAIGYSLGYPGIGRGDTIDDDIGTKLSAAAGDGEDWGDDMLTGLERYLFVGGPRITLAVGWRF